MPPQDDHIYYERRLRASRELARAASDPCVAKIHLNYAAQYQKRLHACDPTLRQPDLAG